MGRHFTPMRLESKRKAMLVLSLSPSFWPKEAKDLRNRVEVVYDVIRISHDGRRNPNLFEWLSVSEPSVRSARSSL